MPERNGRPVSFRLNMNLLIFMFIRSPVAIMEVIRNEPP
jgi:hypothetical protein